MKKKQYPQYIVKSASLTSSEMENLAEHLSDAGAEESAIAAELRTVAKKLDKLFGFRTTASPSSLNKKPT